ncbi:PREDICTED: meckelin-like [Amphimedon queenslandica]|uniref:Meckelin n=2 Tax=Amphimedon queenslandica TaxID=400682 RepID=A0AAN0JKH7_AMPQE|nr:PREDICTED: meckelin-like [Amphimedon queenslandica]|eukprot:XP_019857208.1 PREDICTED: meckelin-like [Amphimedon queenslandica]
MAAAWQVGVHYEIQCSLDPIALMTDGSSPIFYDICILRDNIKDGNMLVPIPVLISGHRDNNGVLVNEGDDSSQWQFVRRFYTHQSVTGTPSYLESTEINIQLTSRGHIQSPYLRLSYQPIPSNDAQASFVVRYSGGNNAFNIALLVIASVFVILAAVYAGLKVNGTYFVANEWNEIQTHRKLNSFFVLMLSLLFLEIIGLGNLAERNPSINVTTPTERYTAPHSSVLRIGLAVIVYLLIAGISRMYTLMIHERYIENKLLQLVDLCSISNISIFILSESLYGHYIHGRSVHGKADTNMKEMNENLIKEKVDMCSKRGLLPDTDEQTFEISISQSFHKQFYKILSQLEAERIENQSNSAAISEASIKAHEEMTTFLSSFIDHNLPSTDYVFRKKWLLEKVLGMEFNDAVDRSIFYTNSGLSFSDVLFYNHEWELLSFELLVFLLVDLLSHNYTLAAIVTFTLSKVVSLIRDGLGKRNLGKKTLIDSRFLI